MRWKPLSADKSRRFFGQSCCYPINSIGHLVPMHTWDPAASQLSRKKTLTNPWHCQFYRALFVFVVLHQQKTGGCGYVDSVDYIITIWDGRPNTQKGHSNWPFFSPQSSATASWNVSLPWHYDGRVPESAWSDGCSLINCSAAKNTIWELLLHPMATSLPDFFFLPPAREMGLNERLLPKIGRFYGRKCHPPVVWWLSRERLEPVSILQLNHWTSTYPSWWASPRRCRQLPASQKARPPCLAGRNSGWRLG